MLRKVTGSTILYQHYHHQHRRRRLFDVTVYPQSNVSPSTAQAVSAAHLASMGYYSRFSFFVFFAFFLFGWLCSFHFTSFIRSSSAPSPFASLYFSLAFHVSQLSPPYLTINFLKWSLLAGLKKQTPTDGVRSCVCVCRGSTILKLLLLSYQFNRSATKAGRNKETHICGFYSNATKPLH